MYQTGLDWTTKAGWEGGRRLINYKRCIISILVLKMNASNAGTKRKKQLPTQFELIGIVLTLAQKNPGVHFQLWLC